MEGNINRCSSSNIGRGRRRYIYTPPSPSLSSASSNQYFCPPPPFSNQHPININQNFFYPPPPPPLVPSAPSLSNNHCYSTPPLPMLMPNCHYNQQQQLQQQLQLFPSHYLQSQRQNPLPLQYDVTAAPTAGIHTTTSSSNPLPPGYINPSHYHHHHHHYQYDDRLYPNTKTSNNNYSSSSAKHQEEDLCNSIMKQIEYYFSDENLIYDEYLKKKMDQKEGWVDVHLIATFPRIRSKTDDVKLILHALQPSQTIEIQGEKIRRRHTWNRWIPLPSSYA